MPRDSRAVVLRVLSAPCDARRPGFADHFFAANGGGPDDLEDAFEALGSVVGGDDREQALLGRPGHRLQWADDARRQSFDRQSDFAFEAVLPLREDDKGADSATAKIAAIGS